MSNQYEVFVDGTGVCDYFVPLDEAVLIQQEYLEQGYENVTIIAKELQI
jgi:hypothetical protein